MEPPKGCVTTWRTKDELALSLARLVTRVVDERVRTTGSCSIAIAGGSLPSLLSLGFRRLAAPSPDAAGDATGAGTADPSQAPWLHTRWFLVDERWVPLSSDEHNGAALLRCLSEVLPPRGAHPTLATPSDAATWSGGAAGVGGYTRSLPHGHVPVYFVDAPASDPAPTLVSAADLGADTTAAAGTGAHAEGVGADADANAETATQAAVARAAAAYAALLRASLAADGKDALDLVVLGHGPDGHIASLFPPPHATGIALLAPAAVVASGPAASAGNEPDAPPGPRPGPGPVPAPVPAQAQPQPQPQPPTLAQAVFASPKPPPTRVSLSWSALLSADVAVVFTTGVEKKPAAQVAWAAAATAADATAGTVADAPAGAGIADAGVRTDVGMRMGAATPLAAFVAHRYSHLHECGHLDDSTSLADSRHGGSGSGSGSGSGRPPAKLLSFYWLADTESSPFPSDAPG